MFERISDEKPIHLDIENNTLQDVPFSKWKYVAFKLNNLIEGEDLDDGLEIEGGYQMVLYDVKAFYEQAKSRISKTDLVIFEDILKSFKVSESIAEAFGSLENLILDESTTPVAFREKTSETIFKIQKAIQELEGEESLLISVGWIGHVVAFKVQRKLNGSFSLSVINTGEGLEESLRYLSKSLLFIRYYIHHKERSYDIKIKKILRNVILNEEFWAQIIILYLEDDPYSTPGKAPILKILELMETYLMKGGVKLRVGKRYRLQQKNGTCSYSAPLSHFESLSGPLLYQLVMRHSLMKCLEILKCELSNPENEDLFAIIDSKPYQGILLIKKMISAIEICLLDKDSLIQEALVQTKLHFGKLEEESRDQIENLEEEIKFLKELELDDETLRLATLDNFKESLNKLNFELSQKNVTRVSLKTLIFGNPQELIQLNELNRKISLLENQSRVKKSIFQKSQRLDFERDHLIRILEQQDSLEKYRDLAYQK